MTVTFNPIVWEDKENGVWSWTSSLGSPVYSIYRDGLLIGTTASESMRLYVAPGEQPHIEVLDAGGGLVYSAPGRVWLSWYPDTSAAHYLIEQAPAGVFSFVATVTESGLGYYRFLTTWLADGYDGQWRITPVDAAGNEGTPLAFVVVQVRHPDVPSVSYTYDPVTAKVTINNLFDEGIIDMAEELVITPSTGTGAISETIADGAGKTLREIRILTTDGAIDMTDLTVTIGPMDANTTGNVVFIPSDDDDAGNISKLIHRFAQPVYVSPEQTIIVTMSNATGKIWELEIVTVNL